MKRERVEDLGVIREKFNILLIEEKPTLFQLVNSKHDIEMFMSKYSNLENIEDLFYELRNLQEYLWSIYQVAEGGEDDDSD